MPARLRLMFWSVAIVAMANAPGGAAELLSGKAFQDALIKKVGVTWAAVPLRDALRELSNETRVAILLDRRLDPSQEVNLTLPPAPLKELIAEATKSIGAGAAIVGNVIYIGPPAAANQLKPLIDRRIDELTKLAAGAPANADKGAKKPAASATPWKSRQATLKQLRTVTWQDLDRPRDVLKQVADKVSIEIDNLDQCPHDLWAAATLPQATTIEVLSLMLVQFDGTFAFLPNRTAIRVFPIADDAPIVAAAAATDKKKSTSAAVPLSKRSIAMKKLDNVSARDLIAQLKNSGFEFDYDRQQLTDAGISLDKKINLAEVLSLPADKFFAEVFKPFGIDVSIAEEIVQLRPKK